MLWKEMEDQECDVCPLYKEEICKGGMSSSGDGTPIEPPCTGFEDDLDLDKWINNYYEGQRRRAEYYAELDRKKAEKQKAEDLRKRRQLYLKFYCAKESQEVKRLKKQIKNMQSAISTANSMAFAFNTTNEMFGYTERVSIRSSINNDLELLQSKLKEAEKALKMKKAEGRKSEEYLLIC